MHYVECVHKNIILAIFYIESVMIGHRFGHQPGLCESSARTSTTLQNGFVFRAYVIFSKTDIALIALLCCAYFARRCHRILIKALTTNDILAQSQKEKADSKQTIIV